jgi:surface protein
MTSPDGITWTIRTSAANSGWYSVAYGNGLWVAVSNNGKVMTSSSYSMLRIVGAGSATLTITQAATSNYVAQIIYVPVTVIEASPNLSLAPITATYGDADFQLLPSSNSDGGKTFSVSPSSVATIVGANNNMLRIVGAGSASLTVTQAATDNYEAQTINVPVTVNKASPNLSLAPIMVTYGDAGFPLLPSSNSAGGKTFSIDNTNVATITYYSWGSIWQFVGVGAGSATLTITQAATSNYEAQTINVAVIVNKASPNLSLAPITATYGDADFQLLPSSSSNGAYTFSVSPSTVATIVGANNNMLRIVGTGTATLTITQVATDNYLAQIITATVTIIVPPPLVLDTTNNVTVKCTLSSISSSPTFIKTNLRGSLEWFAVVDNSSAAYITNYANGIATNGSSKFIPTGQNPPETEPVPFNNIVTTFMTDMSNLFANVTEFNSDISSWDTSRVTNMSYMFYNMKFNSPINHWNTTNVTNMMSMFLGAFRFNQDIGYYPSVSTTAWNTSKVIRMDNMFNGAYAFNQNIGNWITLGVYNMNYMFYNATNFNPNISGWTVTNVNPKPPYGFSTYSPLTTANSPSWT